MICKLSSFIIFLFVKAAWAQTTVTAGVDRDKVGTGDTITLDVTVTSSDAVSVSDPVLPNLSGATLISRSQSTRSQSLFQNGKFIVNNSQTFSYTLSPQKEGTLTIDPVRVNVDGKELQTQPLKVTVIAGLPPQRGNVAQNPQPGVQAPDPFDDEADPFGQMEDVFNQLLRRRANPGVRTQPFNPEDAFFIQVEVDKQKVFVGEQVTANWYLYTRGHIAEIDTLKYPTLKGFWKEDIELATRLNFVGEVINGVAYNKALLTSYALFPLRAGSSSIDPYTAKCKVISGGGFGFGRTYEYTKSSQDLKIQVKELPTAGRPKEFTNGVGEFDVTVNIDRTTVPVGQPVAIKLRIEGKGHAKQIELPQLALPGSVELFDSKADSKFFKSGQSYKDFELVLIPRQEGQITIPELSFAFFNPTSGNYYLRKTNPIYLNVLKGTDTTIAASPLGTPRVETQPAPAAKTFPPLFKSYRPGDTLPFTYLGLWGWLGVLLTVFMVFCGWAYRHLNNTSKRASLRTQLRQRVIELQRLSKSAQWRQLGVEGTNTVFQFLGEISGLGAANFDSNKMIEKMPPTLRKELAGDLKKLLSEFQTLGFAPDEATKSLRDTHQLQQYVVRLDKCLSRAIGLMESPKLEKES